MAGITIHGTIWAQWIHGVETTGTHTVTVDMNHRKITAYASIREWFVIHPYHSGGSTPPSFENGYAGISEAHWDGKSDSIGIPFFSFAATHDTTRIRFKTINTNSVMLINYWNPAVEFAP